MKQFCRRMMALLLAMMLAGVFDVLAEEYTEYSGGLTVADMRAATGYADLYVCIDGVWTDVVDIQIAGTSGNRRYVKLSDVADALSDYGFSADTYKHTEVKLPYYSGNALNPSQVYYWSDTTTVPVSTNDSNNMLYYTPHWGTGYYNKKPADIASTNSFYTLTVEGLNDADLATVDYNDAYSAGGKHLVFTGGTARISVPANYSWSYTGTYDMVSTSTAENLTTYTFTNVTSPIVMTAEAVEGESVTVTINIRDLTGNVVSTTEWNVASGGSLSAEAISSAPDGYCWYTEDGAEISGIAAWTFDAATTLYVAPQGFYGDGYGANFLVYVDEAWKVVATTDVLFGPSDGRYAVTLEQLVDAFSDYGFSEDNFQGASETRFGQNGESTTTVWADTRPVQFGDTWVYPMGHTYGERRYNVYYLPNNTGTINGSERDTLAADNAFHTVTMTESVSGATTQVILEDDTNLSQYLASLGDTMLQGWNNPVSALEWYTDTNGTLLADTDTAKTVQTLVGLTPYVTVTLRVLDYDGNVVSEEEVQVRAGSTLPSETLAKYSTAYQWYNAAGTPIYSISIQTFLEDTVVTTYPPVNTSAKARFFVYLDDRWQQVGTADELYGPYYTTYANRYLVTASQMEEAFGDYGFDADSYNSASDRRFAYVVKDGTTVWADTTPFEYYGEWVLPLGDGVTTYDVYYLPHNTGTLKGPSITDEELTSANSFHTVTLTEEDTGATFTVILDDTTNLAEYLDKLGDSTLTGWAYPVSEHTWVNEATGEALTATDTPATVQNLLGMINRVTITMVDDAGTQLAQLEAMQGKVLADWLAAHDGDVLDNGKTVHEYSWELLNDVEISTQLIEKDLTLVGTLKPVYTVTFVDQNPNGAEAGGSFANDSTEYTTLQVIAGDTIPAEFIARMRANIELEADYAFVEWQYAGNEGYLVMDANTPIVQDTVVWADYTQEVYVRFWTSRDMTTRFTAEGKENQQVGQLYDGVYPDEAAIAAAAPAEGMRFRYWMDVGTGQVFTLEEDLVKHNLNLYPVYERAIFEFVDRDGTELDALYEGTALLYEAEPVEGSFYLGLEAVCEDGTTVIIPDGTLITREYLDQNNIRYTGPVNGRYTITAEPAYSQQRKVVYHTGDGAQFIIFGAEDQSSYTVTVDDELVLLGALDIINTVSPIGLALAGWTTTPGGTDAEFAPNATYEGSDELDTLVAAGGTIDLYPVWAQQTNTIAITFKSNYPDDATDADGNALTEKTYTVYIKSGTKPTMPTLERAGMSAPQNTLDSGKMRYTLAGWALDQDGHLTDTSESSTQYNGTYVTNSQYQHTVSENKTFYAIWVDESEPESGYTAYFHIRADGILPIEPGQFGQSAYYPAACSGNNAWPGMIKKQLNVVNNVAEVEANILEEPDLDKILTRLQSESTYVAAFSQIVDVTVDDYGTEWWIDWYACKNVGCVSGGHYHVDGRVRFSDQVELNYHPNGGTNVPAGTVHTKNTSAVVNKTQLPTRENFTFIGWDEDPAAKIPDYPAEGLTFTGSLNEDEIYMDSDKTLYAIWQPIAITIPMDDDFKGQKYEQTNDGNPTAPQDGRRYQFTIEAVTLPEGADPYEKRTVTSKTDGSFTFPQINVKVAGMYVFEVREVVGDLAVQYDTSVYRLTINIVQSDYGLGIAGYSFTRNNKVIPVTDNNVDNVVFTFTNRTDVRNVTVQKVWDDAYDQDGVRPGSVTLTLLREGDHVYSDEVTLNAVGNWTYTWTGLDIKAAGTGEIYQYYVVEDAVLGYTTSYSGDMNAGLTVTNTHEPATADFRVVKTWVDGSNAGGIRPETLVYTITGKNPQGVTVYTETTDPVADPWSYTFEDLPLYAGGDPITYTLTEQTPAGYESEVSTHANSTGDGGVSYSVLNKQVSTNVTVTKQIEGNASTTTDIFDFTAKVYDAAGNQVTDLTAGEGYTVNADGTLTFSLSDDQSVELLLLPLGGRLEISEEAGDYTAVWLPEASAADGTYTYTIANGLAITVTNTREVIIQTGLVVETEPYLMLLGFVLMGILGWQYRRRRV